MLLLSRQAKNLSRPSQHRSREVRSGAMRPPSEAFEVSVDEEDQGSQPMLIVIGNRRGGKDKIERLVVADNVV